MTVIPSGGGVSVPPPSPSNLDGIAGGKLTREEFLGVFYERFQKMLARAEVEFGRYGVAHPERDRKARVRHDEPCGYCGGVLIVRTGKTGRYAKCESCGKTKDLAPLKEAKRPCPRCRAPVVEQPYRKDGKQKRFYRCTGCDWRSSSAPGRVRKEPCPECGRPMMERKKAGKAFWACTGYPECREMAWIEKKRAKGSRGSGPKRKA